MSFELIYTSAPRGLKPGSMGFCAVAATRGLPPALADRLESLSGYRPLFPLGDARANQNPINCSHYRLSAGGRAYSVLSAVRFAGADYSGRSNKFAHHLALESQELSSAGPAQVLRQPDLFRTSWTGEPELLSPRALPAIAPLPAAPCAAWQRATGDAGWAGAVVDQFVLDPSRAYHIIVPREVDALALIAEMISLLPDAQRWQPSFSTYFTDPPAGLSCTWRMLVADSPIVEQVRRQSGVLLLDLSRPLGTPASSRYVEMARSGHRPDPASMPAPRGGGRVVVDRPSAAASTGASANPYALTDSADPYETKVESFDIYTKTVYTAKPQRAGRRWLTAPVVVAAAVLTIVIGGGVLLNRDQAASIGSNAVEQAAQQAVDSSAGSDPTTQAASGRDPAGTNSDNAEAPGRRSTDARAVGIAEEDTAKHNAEAIESVLRAQRAIERANAAHERYRGSSEDFVRDIDAAKAALAAAADAGSSELLSVAKEAESRIPALRSAQARRQDLLADFEKAHRSSREAIDEVRKLHESLSPAQREELEQLERAQSSILAGNPSANEVPSEAIDALVKDVSDVRQRILVLRRTEFYRGVERHDEFLRRRPVYAKLESPQRSPTGGATGEPGVSNTPIDGWTGELLLSCWNLIEPPASDKVRIGGFVAVNVTPELLRLDRVESAGARGERLAKPEVVLRVSADRDSVSLITQPDVTQLQSLSDELKNNAAFLIPSNDAPVQRVQFREPTILIEYIGVPVIGIKDIVPSTSIRRHLLVAGRLRLVVSEPGNSLQLTPDAAEGYPPEVKITITVEGQSVRSNFASQLAAAEKEYKRLESVVKAKDEELEAETVESKKVPIRNELKTLTIERSKWKLWQDELNAVEAVILEWQTTNGVVLRRIELTGPAKPGKKEGE